MPNFDAGDISQRREVVTWRTMKRTGLTLPRSVGKARHSATAADHAVTLDEDLASPVAGSSSFSCQVPDRAGDGLVLERLPPR